MVSSCVDPARSEPAVPNRCLRRGTSMTRVKPSSSEASIVVARPRISKPRYGVTSFRSLTSGRTSAVPGREQRYRQEYFLG
jgi:hypothetical protein